MGLWQVPPRGDLAQGGLVSRDGLWDGSVT